MQVRFLPMSYEQKTMVCCIFCKVSEHQQQQKRVFKNSYWKPKEL